MRRSVARDVAAAASVLQSAMPKAISAAPAASLGPENAEKPYGPDPFLVVVWRGRYEEPRAASADELIAILGQAAAVLGQRSAEWGAIAASRGKTAVVLGRAAILDQRLEEWGATAASPGRAAVDSAAAAWADSPMSAECPAALLQTAAFPVVPSLAVPSTARPGAICHRSKSAASAGTCLEQAYRVALAGPVAAASSAVVASPVGLSNHLRPVAAAFAARRAVGPTD